MFHLGVIGFGLRAQTMAAAMLATGEEVCFSAICDPDEQAAYDFFQKHALKGPPNFVPDLDALLQVPGLDGILLGTRCNLHAVFASKILARGIPLFLEKPVAITLPELQQLEDVANKYPCAVTVSFPLRLTALCQKMKKILDSGEIGDITQVQAYNNVPYGGVYYHSWYRDEALTGGLFLQKATHDLDYLHYLLGQYPTKVFALESKQYYKGRKPAGLRCEQCAERKTCRESDWLLLQESAETVHGPWCCFAQDVGNHDSASVLMQYANGMHSVYTQNFVAKKGAAKRGARFIGTEGTAEFDWYSEKIQLWKHYSTDVTVITCPEDQLHGHSGGDHLLALDFFQVLRGEASQSDLRSGINSARLCLKAKESARTHQFLNVFDI